MMTIFETVWQQFSHPISLLAMGSGALVMAILGPFGTFGSVPFPTMLVFWVLIAVSATFLALLCHEVMVRSRRQSITTTIASGVLFTVAFTPIVLVLRSLVWGAESLSLGFVVQHYFFVAVLTAPIIALVYVARASMAKPTPVEVAQVPPVTEVALDRFLQSAGACTESQLLYLRSDDHHLEVATDNGVHRVRRRLSDAVRELDGAPGLRVHRSYWVSLSAIDRVEQDRRGVALALKDGSTLPVGSSYRNAVEQALG